MTPTLPPVPRVGPVRAIIERIGRRAAVLLAISIMSLWWGWLLGRGLHLDTPPSLPLIPLPLRAWLWAVAGVLGLLAATVRRPRYVTTGYAVLVWLPLERATAAIAGLVWTGRPEAALEALGWLAVAAVVHVCAGWPDDTRQGRAVPHG